MDRVILKNCKLAYAGVYSDAEAEEFTQPVESSNTITDEQQQVLMGLFKTYSEKKENVTVDGLVKHTLETNKIDDIKDLPVNNYADILQKIKKDLGGK